MRVETYFFESLENECKKEKFFVGFPEDDDSRILEACARMLKKESLKEVLFARSLKKIFKALPVLEEHKSKIKTLADDFETTSSDTKLFYEQYLDKKKKIASKAEINSWAEDPMHQMAVLLRQDKIHGVISGAQYTTASVIQTGLAVIGCHPKAPLLSSSFVLDHPHRPEVLLFADCGVVVDPTGRQLAQIASNSLKTFAVVQKILAQKPVVGFLSFSTEGSASHPMVSKVQEGRELFSIQHPDVACGGEWQFDTAYNLDIRKRKIKGDFFDEKVNLFVFPNLDSANIAYKITQQIGSFCAYGPILQGFQKPFSDLSRGASVTDIVASTYITLLSHVWG